MMKSNVEIIQDFVEQVMNQKNFDAYDQYFSSDYIAHGNPYVGNGFSLDSSENKHIINMIFPGSPAEGNLQVGDELIFVESENQRWDTYEEIEQGSRQTSQSNKFKLGIRRDDQTIVYDLTKALIKGYNISKDQAKSGLQNVLTEEFPDLKATILQTLADDDRLVCFLEYHGTHAKFKREVVWREAWFMRLSEGKIVEDWGASDSETYYRQLGYQLIPPSTPED